MRERIYLSGYTKKNNKGINIVDIEYTGDRLEIVSVKAIDEENPSYIAMSEDKNTLFSITSRKDGGVSLFKKSNGKYELRDTFTGLGKAPCHLYFDEKKELLYSSNYHLGKLHIFKISVKEGNDVLNLVNTIEFHGNSIVSPNQDSSKCHMAIKDREDENLIVVDLGGDTVYAYSVEGTGKVSLLSEYKTKLGMGPRHIVFSNCGEFAYLLGELDSSIDALKYDKSSGRFSLMERVSMLPDDYRGENSGAAIKISKNGRYLYSSNRGHDSVAVFEIMNDGRLSMKEVVKTGGKTPRDFGFTPDERYLFVGHQDSDEVTVFNINSETGLLSMIEDLDLKLPEITCVIY